MHAEKRYNADDLKHWGLMAVICTPILAVVLVPLFQVLRWLKTGQWVSMDLASVGCSLNGDWFCSPMSWQGLHTAFEHIHVSIGVAAVMAGVVTVFQK